MTSCMCSSPDCRANGCAIHRREQAQQFQRLTSQQPGNVWQSMTCYCTGECYRTGICPAAARSSVHLLNRLPTFLGSLSRMDRRGKPIYRVKAKSQPA
jgi:hypothetical protein